MSWKPKGVPEFVHAFMASLPIGEIWPREPGSTLVRTVTALMGVVGRWADRVATFLLVEAFPPTSFHLLPDWERVLGLPDPCYPVVGTLDERRAAVRDKLARRPGGQSRAYFTDIARRLGYHVDGPSPSALPLTLPAALARLPQIRITEYRPFMAGVSRAGDPDWSIGPPEMRFLWTVTIPGRRLTWFRSGSGEAGTDPHLQIATADDIECIFKKLKPAHTVLFFDYTGA